MNREESKDFLKKFVNAVSLLMEDFKEEIPEVLPPEVTTPKETIEKTKAPKESKLVRNVFTKNEPAKTAAERKVFNEQWKALGPKQEDYLAGKIDSLGSSLDAEPEVEAEFEASEELATDFEDFSTEEKITLESLRNLCSATALKFDQKKIYKVMADFKVKKLSELDEKHYKAFKEALESIK